MQIQVSLRGMYITRETKNGKRCVERKHKAATTVEVYRLYNPDKWSLDKGQAALGVRDGEGKS